MTASEADTAYNEQVADVVRNATAGRDAALADAKRWQDQYNALLKDYTGLKDHLSTLLDAVAVLREIVVDHDQTAWAISVVDRARKEI